MDNRAIGIFDSGLGGLTAVDALRKLMRTRAFGYPTGQKAGMSC